jgi:hypothetical protein
MATLFKFDGQQAEVQPENGHNFQLEELYRLLDCTTIEIVNIADAEDEILIIDEESRLNPDFLKTYNRDLSNLAGYNLFGNALLCKTNEVE